jgi:hypothetical protein
MKTLFGVGASGGTGTRNTLTLLNYFFLNLSLVRKRSRVRFASWAPYLNPSNHTAFPSRIGAISHVEILRSYRYLYGQKHVGVGAKWGKLCALLMQIEIGLRVHRSCNLLVDHARNLEVLA